jgi:hypothetical protein
LPLDRIKPYGEDGSMGKLHGKVAVITAATSGMALATAKLFVDEGAYIFIPRHIVSTGLPTSKETSFHISGERFTWETWAQKTRICTPFS